jgi:hypothetical protein
MSAQRDVLDALRRGINSGSPCYDSVGNYHAVYPPSSSYFVCLRPKHCPHRPAPKNRLVDMR